MRNDMLKRLHMNNEMYLFVLKSMIIFIYEFYYSPGDFFGKKCFPGLVL